MTHSRSTPGARQAEATFGDDAFGCEVTRELAARPLPERVRVIDFGIRGLDLTYALLDGYETVVLVDATPRGGRPGARSSTSDGGLDPGGRRGRLMVGGAGLGQEAGREGHPRRAGGGW